MDPGSASPCGAPIRRFWARGPYFRMGRANLIRSAFAAFIRIPCSRERQSHVVGPDGDPSLPDDMVANHARGRRILLRLMSALEKRPSRTGHADYIPKSGNVKIVAVPGRASSREPGIQIPAVMDSAPAPSAHPGMTGWEIVPEHRVHIRTRRRVALPSSGLRVPRLCLRPGFVQWDLSSFGRGESRTETLCSLRPQSPAAVPVPRGDQRRTASVSAGSPSSRPRTKSR
jgi:hypothetical protein